MVGILVLLVLLLPTVGAVIARILGRKFGSKVTVVVGALGFAGALGCALALHWVDVDRATLGSWAIFIPRPGPVIDAAAFTLPRQPVEAPPDEPPVVAVVEPSPTLESVATAPSGDVESETAEPPVTTLPADVAAPSPTMATPTRTVEPTSSPTTQLASLPTSMPTASPTSAPTILPTAPPRAAPAPRASATPRPTAVPPTATSLPARAQAYVVKPGDTLRGIAERFGISVEALLRYNGLSAEEADSLRPSQELSIPSQASGGQAGASRPTARPTAPASKPTTRPAAPASRPTERAAAPTSGPSARIQLYVVKPGDTLRSIAAKFDIGVDALLSFNGLTRAEGDRLRPDQKLYIPPRR
jgi:LysM repeat protein